MITRYDPIIKSAVAKHLPGYDYRLFKAQLYQESKLDPEAISPAGAEGIGQFMPLTWDEWAPRAGFHGVDRRDPKASIFTAAMYMSYLIGEWSWPRPEIDRHCLALSSYNAGLGHILAAQRQAGNPSLYAEIIKKLPEVTGDHSKETIGYVKKILGYCSDLVTG